MVWLGPLDYTPTAVRLACRWLALAWRCRVCARAAAHQAAQYSDAELETWLRRAVAAHRRPD